MYVRSGNIYVSVYFEVLVIFFAAGSRDEGSDPLDHGYPLRPLG